MYVALLVSNMLEEEKVPDWLYAWGYQLSNLLALFGKDMKGGFSASSKLN